MKSRTKLGLAGAFLAMMAIGAVCSARSNEDGDFVGPDQDKKDVAGDDTAMRAAVGTEDATVPEAGGTAS